MRDEIADKSVESALPFTDDGPVLLVMPNRAADRNVPLTFRDAVEKRKRDDDDLARCPEGEVAPRAEAEVLGCDRVELRAAGRGVSRPFTLEEET